MIPDYAIYSDKELAQQLLQGKQGAFEELYDRYWQSIFNTVYKRLNQLFFSIKRPINRKTLSCKL